MSRKLKHDLRYLVSALLVVVTAFVAVTGIVADLWDLNDFVLHTLPGYAMTALALVHTIVELPRLVAYVRGRARSRRREKDVPAENDGTHPPHNAPDAKVVQTVISRRGVLGLLVGGAGGFWAGRLLPRGTDGAEERDLGLRYHVWSRPGAASLLEGSVDWGERPDPYKVYPDAERVSLPSPTVAGNMGTLAAIEQRRSRRDYGGTPMTRGELSTLLYSADGINRERGSLRLRASPSAGALYPIETYVLVHDVEDVAPGLYHYALRDHALERLRAEDLRQESVRLGLMQGFLGDANVVIVLTAIFQRLRWRYRRRSYRYALLEAGHIGQNVYLASTAMGFGACAVGAFLDEGLNNLLDIDGREEAALYMLPVGRTTP
jgi:SagB-type dehydrogenase family enzyme